jgi:hypothetical protein
MKREYVKSSNIRAIGYDKSTEILEVEFHTSGVYQYFEVPEDIYKKLLSSSSIGSFFQKNIREKYRCLKIK